MSVADVGRLQRPAQADGARRTSVIPQGPYAALGDSVAAGPGLQGSLGPCYRSDEAYPTLVQTYFGIPSSSFLNIPCFGASTTAVARQKIQGGILDGQALPNGQHLAPQLVSAKAFSPMLMTLTVGANDVRWGDIVWHCYSSSTPCDQLATQQGTAESLFGPNLKRLKSNLSNALQQMASWSPTPQVIVTDYYWPFPETYQPCILMTGITSNEYNYMLARYRNLQSAIQNVVKAPASHASLASVHDPFVGHDVCSSDSWIILSIHKDFNFHPTKDGQAAIASQIEAATSVGTIEEFPVPTPFSTPSGITRGPDGNIWFVENNGNKIGKVTPSGAFTEYAIPTPNAYPESIATGSDGNLWFTESYVNKIGKITLTGAITEYTVPTGGSAPFDIAEGPDGNMWFTETLGNKIGKITHAGDVTEYPIPTPGSSPEGIAAGPDGNLWFTEGYGNKIGKVTIAGAFTEYVIPTIGSGPIAITAAPPGGDIWFTERDKHQIGRVTTEGSFTEYPVPTNGSQPYGIAAGSDGNIWFTEPNVNKVGMVTIAGIFTEYAAPTDRSAPLDLVVGDGSVWFTEAAANKIALLIP